MRVRRCLENPHLASVKRDRDAAIGQAAQRGDAAVEAPDLGGGGAVEAEDRHPVDDVKGLAVGGEILGRLELADRLGFLQNAVGAIASPFDSFLALRGLKTLGVRMQRHCENALEIAAWLEAQPEVRWVRYPGLTSHPQHALALTQMHGFGGMIAVELNTDLAGTKRMLEACEIFALAESLGGVESLIEHPAIMTHASIPAELREKAGIADALIRLSVGIEEVEDLKKDLRRALDRVHAA